MKLPHFLKKLIPGYEVIDLKEWRQKGEIEIYLKKIENGPAKCLCSRCGHELGNSTVATHSNLKQCLYSILRPTLASGVRSAIAQNVKKFDQKH